MENIGNPNMKLWDSVEMTDPQYTKNFNRPGGFRGTSIGATYMAMKATQAFGPMGIGWGVNVVKEDYVEGHIICAETGQKYVNHTIQVVLWYLVGDKRGEVTHFGQTPFICMDKKGIKTDEEAPKKSLTDATNKALSMLGFSADIFMGKWDDDDYRQLAADTAAIANADDSAEEIARQETEYQEWARSHIALVSTARNSHELRTLFNLGERKMNQRNDTKNFAKLEQAKDARVEEFKKLILEQKNVAS